MAITDRRTLMGGALSLSLTDALPAAARQSPGEEFRIRVNVANGRYIKHRPKVAVASYGVSYFYTGRTRTLSGSGGAMINTALYGVTPEMMAEVAEAACQDLRQRLAAAGETVVGVERPARPWPPPSRPCAKATRSRDRAPSTV